jgi:hypothetical protein
MDNVVINVNNNKIEGLQRYDGTLVTLDDFLKDVELIKQNHPPIHAGVGLEHTEITKFKREEEENMIKKKQALKLPRKNYEIELAKKLVEEQRAKKQKE